jgi:hypothetical protein
LVTNINHACALFAPNGSLLLGALSEQGWWVMGESVGLAEQRREQVLRDSRWSTECVCFAIAATISMLRTTALPCV